MTVLSITAGSVVAGANAVKKRALGGVAAITAGMAIYRNTTDGRLYMSDADAAAAAAWDVHGIALNGGGIGQPIEYQTSGDITIGGTLTVGEIYVLDTSAGGIAPKGDLASGEHVAVIGVAISTSVLRMCIGNSGVAVP